MQSHLNCSFMIKVALYRKITEKLPKKDFESKDFSTGNDELASSGDEIDSAKSALAFLVKRKNQLHFLLNERVE